jgi:hypothetical protein
LLCSSQLNIRPDEPLVDAQGYPRTDINVHSIRNLRNRLAGKSRSVRLQQTESSQFLSHRLSLDFADSFDHRRPTHFGRNGALAASLPRDHRSRAGRVVWSGSWPIIGPISALSHDSSDNAELLTVASSRLFVLSFHELFVTAFKTLFKPFQFSSPK